MSYWNRKNEQNEVYRFRPAAETLLVEPVFPATTLSMPDNAGRIAGRGVVVAVGAEVTGFEVGDTVLFHEGARQEIELNDQQPGYGSRAARFGLVNVDNLLGKIDPPPKVVAPPRKELIN